jgi:uncharacterized protein involved in outer membrane biogenesis
MKRALIVGLAVVGLLIALVALSFLIPLPAYRGQIESRATAATGRNVRIEGPLRISLFPILGLDAKTVLAGGATGSALKGLFTGGGKSNSQKKGSVGDSAKSHFGIH